MQNNRITDTRTPKGQKNYEPYELTLFKQAHQTLTVKQVVSILEFLGSKRSKGSVSRKSNECGWTLKKASK